MMSNCNSCPSKGKCGKNEESCGVVNNPNNKIKYVIGVMSGKGGVGKSSVTVLLAKQMRAMGYEVGIMDADITGPSIPRLLGVEKEHAYGANDCIYPIVDKNGIKSISLNNLIEDENQPVVWRGPIVGNAVKQFWSDVVWGELDVLFIDMPPGTGDVALTVLQSIPVNGVVMVSTPQPMVSMIVSKAMNMCKQMNISVLGVVENMSYVLCPDCGKEIRLHKTTDTEQFIEQNDTTLLMELPMMESIANLNQDDDNEETIAYVESLVRPAIVKMLGALK